MAGDYTGVGFLSSAPTRAAAQRWHPDVVATARLPVVNAFLDPFWLLAGVCYGYASGPPCKTHSLLEHLTERVVDASAAGPRVLARDFNLAEDCSPCLEHWSHHGFVELQQIRARALGAPLEPTCKNKTRKDLIYVSPELVPFVQEVWLEQDWFPDHAVLFGWLKLPAQPLPRPVWYMPRPHASHVKLCHS